ncbi:glycine cleavage system protein H [Synechococcus sp. Cruz CV-v-12]|uniref:glycine cleavage system protein H n=1 Tax=Synechococcus sp. Cruz CV-v-12 TaxID=2823728 RepID=UPI0020CDA211|nr:glycine cleavage system H protein [Synechococcus sp. Cruz CV-v-12]MCP9874832.1 glycine cleavage system protein H [Synechococcus sp. Cruz CV-v-12]
MASPADCLYSNSHEWHRVTGDTLTLGITRFAVDALTDVTYANMKPVGTKIASGGIIGEVESVKTTSDIYSACAGEIIEVNKAVIDNPAALNADPFANWLVKLKISEKAGLATLMDGATYDKAHPIH